MSGSFHRMGEPDDTGPSMFGRALAAVRIRSRDGDECRRFRPLLLEMVDDRSIGRNAPDRADADERTREALEHLWRCDACQREVAEMLLVVAGLRRLGQIAAGVQPPAEGWQRLLPRLSAVGPRRPHRRPLVGLMIVPVLAALLVAPGLGRTLTGSGLDSQDVSPPVAAAGGPPAQVLLAAVRRRALDVSNAASGTVSGVPAGEAPAAEAPADGMAQAVDVAPRGALPDGLDLGTLVPAAVVAAMPGVVAQ